jgi:two-component system response regulator HydG
MTECVKQQTKEILVIDDDRNVLSSIQRQLRKQDFKVELENDPLNAIKKLNRKKYDLVLCDVKMKPISGLEVLKKIKTSHPDTPVIILTGYVDDTIRNTAESMGSDDFLIKPIRRQDLISSINRVFGMI